MHKSKFEFEAIGTHWTIDIESKDPILDEANLYKKIQDRINVFDVDYSRFRDDSLVTKISSKAGEYVLPKDAELMISIYKKMYDITGGLVTPLIGKVLEDAGYDAGYSLKQKPMIRPEAWEKIMKWENPVLTMHHPALLDFGAGGKGYLVDIVSDILESDGIESYCVDAGGDMRHRSAGQKSLRVGLENPNDTSSIIGVTVLQNKSLCGSAGNRRAWGDFHHIINPETLISPREISAVWTIASTTLVADILTTGLFFVSPDVLLKHFDFEYCICYSDFSVSQSKGFKAELYLE